MGQVTETPNLEELGNSGKTIKEVLAGDDGRPRTITVTISPEEYARIGGTEEALNELSKEVSDFVNLYIMES